MNLVSREIAARTALKRYYTGRPCRRGHDSERYTSTGNCCECSARPVGMFIRMSVEVHQGDRLNVEAYVNALRMARNLDGLESRPDASADEIEYWKMIARYRRHGVPEAQIGQFREYKMFTLPEGQNP